MTDIREILPYEISDEAAAHLVDFFYSLALTFESLHLGKVMRYQKSIAENNGVPQTEGD